jgi:hypothetical protein
VPPVTCPLVQVSPKQQLLSQINLLGMTYSRTDVKISLVQPEANPVCEI